MDSTERWTQKDGGHYCTAHQSTFPRGEVCQLCVADPGAPLGASADRTVDREALAVELELDSEAKIARRRADDPYERNEWSTAAKWHDSYLKTRRLWREMRTERMQIESDERLVEHDRKINGLRGDN